MALPTSSLGPNFSYTLNNNITTLTLNNNFTTNNWSQIDISHSSNTDQVVIDGNNKTITIDQTGFGGLFYAGNTFNGTTKPTIIKNLTIKSAVNLKAGLAQVNGYVRFENCHFELDGNITDNGGGLAYNDLGGSGSRIELVDCSTRVNGKIGANSGPLIGYISSNSGNKYIISNCSSVVSDSTALSGPRTLGSGAGAFVGSGISNAVSISSSYCLFNGSMSYGSGVIAGKFLGSSSGSEGLAIDKFYLISNVVAAPYSPQDNSDPDPSHHAFYLSSYHGGFAPSSFSLANVNILELGIGVGNIYGTTALVSTLNSLTTYSSVAEFVSAINATNARVGSNVYDLRINGGVRTLPTAHPNFSNAWAFDLTAGTLQQVAGITIRPFGVVDSNGNLITGETGVSSEFVVVLNKRPTADVIVTLSGLNPTEGSLNATTLTFTSDDWFAGQHVTVVGLNDALADGSVTYRLVATASSTGGYSTSDTATIGIVNLDDEAPFVTPVLAPPLIVAPVIPQVTQPTQQPIPTPAASVPAQQPAPMINWFGYKVNFRYCLCISRSTYSV